jgi:hypothetical protein
VHRGPVEAAQSRCIEIAGVCGTRLCSPGFAAMEGSVKVCCQVLGVVEVMRSGRGSHGPS